MNNPYRHLAKSTWLLPMLFIIGCATSTKPTIPESEVVETQRSPAFLLEELPGGLNQLLNQAKAQSEQGTFDMAIVTLDQAKQDYPNFPQPFFNHALLEFKNENYEQTDQLLEQTLMIRDGYPPALNLKGVLARIAGQFEQAKTWYEQSIQRAPQYSNAWLNLGVLADMYLQQLELAEQAYQEYLLLHGDDKTVANWLLDLQRRMPAPAVEE